MHVRAITPSKMNAAKIRIKPSMNKINWHGNKYLQTYFNLYSINIKRFLLLNVSGHSVPLAREVSPPFYKLCVKILKLIKNKYI